MNTNPELENALPCSVCGCLFGDHRAETFECPPLRQGEGWRGTTFTSSVAAATAEQARKPTAVPTFAELIGEAEAAWRATGLMGAVQGVALGERRQAMKPHHFNEDADGTCELCGKSAEHPIHELDAVPLGDAEHDPREDERRDDELTGDVRDFAPLDEPDSGFDVP